MENILKKIVSMLKIPISEEKVTVLYQFIKFGLVGVSNTVISYVVYIAGIYVGLHYFWANVLGFIISVLNSFYWNNKYVFTRGDDEKRNLLKALVKTFISYGSTGIILATVLLYLWVDIVGLSEYIAPLINLIITIPLNFILNKLWAFREEPKG